MTSHDVVAVARRALRVRRIGHAGTLDPFATGLLVLLVGRCTRLLPYLEGDPKVYDATIAFGAETTTDDRTGETVREAEPPSPVAVAAGIAALTGDLDQLPPAYSAKQVEGRRAYAAARRGAPLPLAPARVRVDSWEVIAQDADRCRVRITCGGGTYIRSLARDLGRIAGSAAHLEALHRERVGPFHVRDAAPLDRDAAAPALLPSIAALPSWPRRSVNGEERVALVHGRPIPASPGNPREAAVDDAGQLVALLVSEGDSAWPKLVLAGE